MPRRSATRTTGTFSTSSASRLTRRRSRSATGRRSRRSGSTSRARSSSSCPTPCRSTSSTRTGRTATRSMSCRSVRSCCSSGGGFLGRDRSNGCAQCWLGRADGADSRLGSMVVGSELVLASCVARDLTELIAQSPTICATFSCTRMAGPTSIPSALTASLELTDATARRGSDRHRIRTSSSSAPTTRRSRPTSTGRSTIRTCTSRRA